MNEEARRLAHFNFDRWEQALISRDPEKISLLYTKSDDLAFLPTLSPELITDRNGVREYFTHFMQKNPVGKIVADRATMFGEEYLSYEGLYDFEIDGSSGRELVHARFTFEWRKESGEWKIFSHHSSLVPGV